MWKKVFKKMSLSNKIFVIFEFFAGIINLIFGVINNNLCQLLFGFMCVIIPSYVFLIERQNAIIDSLFILLKLKEEDDDTTDSE